MSKKIYQVFDSKDKTVVEEGFASRSAAKVTRNELNDMATVNDLKRSSRFVVNRGTDHPRGQSTGEAEQSKRWL